jgi:hypothetical protein
MFMSTLIITSLTASIAASANYFADRLHNQIDNLLSKDMNMANVSLTISDNDMDMMHEIASHDEAKRLGIANILSPERASKGRLTVSLEQIEKVFLSTYAL